MRTIITSSISETDPCDLFLLTREGQIESSSDAAAEYFGFAAGALLVELGDPFASSFIRAQQCAQQITTTADGRVVEWSLRTLPGDDRVLATGHEVSSSIRERDELRLNVQRLDAVLRNMTDLAWMKDRDSRFVFVNEALAELAGTTSAEMIGRTDADYFPAGHVQTYLAGDEQVFASRCEVKTVDEIVNSAGETRWIESIKRPVFDPSGTVTAVAGVARDVSDRRTSEAERQDLIRQLATQHQRLTDTIQNVPGVVWEEWFDGSYRYVSNAVLDMLGYTPEEYMQRFESFMNVLHPDDLDAVSARTKEMIATATGGAHSFRMIHRDGRALWCESHCSMIIDGGRVVGLRGVAMDVTSRIAAENTLRQSEERFRELVATAPVMLWTTDAEGSLTFVSRQLLDFIGLNAADALGEGWLQGIHPGDRQHVVDTLTEAIHRQGAMRYEARYRAGDGTYRQIIVEGVPRFNEHGAFVGLVGNTVDLTELRQLERRIEESRRLSSLGRLAATIAHEINNVLMGVQPFAEAIARSSSQETIRNAAAQIRKSVDRGRRITHAILGYANTAAPRLQPVDVSQWMHEHLPELRAIAGEMVSLQTRIEKGLVTLADAGQLQQVFTNLVANARDAMDGGGVVSIEARKGEGNWQGMVHFTVTDTGCGMELAVLEQIFEPLFTTKSVGTGLGLPLVREILAKHGGEITAESNPDHGAVFHLALPSTTADPEVAAVSVSFPAVAYRRILLVEDDLAVSSGLTALLELEGMEVAVAERGVDALPAIDAFRPDAVLLDVGLPDASGTEVFSWIRAAHPSLPLLFSTGHGREAELKKYLAEPATGYLLKPYSIEDLMEAMARI